VTYVRWLACKEEKAASSIIIASIIHHQATKISRIVILIDIDETIEISTSLFT